MQGDIIVAYLGWIPLGKDPFRAFVSSYLNQNAGMNHRLVVAFNGYKNESQLSEYRALLRNIPHDECCIPDPGFDIKSYRIVARKYSADIFCFLNSYCVFLSNNWLKILYDACRQPKVGCVAATGSFGCSVFLQKHQLPGDNPWYKRPTRFLRSLWYRRYFDPFPCPHLRTNGFMIARELFLDIEMPVLKTKIDTYLVEHGKNSMTNQVLRRGLKACVVDRYGRTYEPVDWPQSNCFWMGDQDNLLIADNRTEFYRTANLNVKECLTKTAWGI